VARKGSSVRSGPELLEEELLESLTHAQRLGFVGPGSLTDHLAHSRAFAALVAELLEGRAELAPMARVVDLGSGGGVPGLMLAARLAHLPPAPGRGPVSISRGIVVPEDSVRELWLVEASESRAAFLVDALSRLGLSHGATVVAARAESLAREETFRSSFDIVTARAFGRPAVVAECAAPLLRVGGWLVVSEPPLEQGGPSERWDEAVLGQLGLGAPQQREVGSYQFALLRQEQPCPPGYPRRVGVPAKRPLF